MEDNSHAGQGAVVLDIGGDVGAVILRMPRELIGAEIEARPAGAVRHDHAHAPAHHHNDHHNDHHHDASHDHGHLPHVAVLERPMPGSAGLEPTAVFFELTEGRYELYVRPAGDVALTVLVTGGEVTVDSWPAST